MSNILLIQIPSGASAADWQQVQVALSEARQASYPSDIGRSVTPVVPTVPEATPPMTNVVPTNVVPINTPAANLAVELNACSACGRVNGDHKGDCMYHPANKPENAFVDPVGDPEWLKAYVSANGLPVKGSPQWETIVSEHWADILAVLKGRNATDIGPELTDLRKSANMVRTRAIKVHKESFLPGGNGAPVVNAPQQAMNDILSKLSLSPAQQQVFVPSAPQQVVQPTAPVADFDHVTQLTEAQRVTLAQWAGNLTTDRQALLIAFLNGQATSAMLKNVSTKDGNFYDKVKAKIAKV